MKLILSFTFADCSIVSSRVILLLDDLLWVLTETQLKAALLYATSLQEVIEKSTHQSKQLAAEKLKVGSHFRNGSEFLWILYEVYFIDYLARLASSWMTFLISDGLECSFNPAELLKVHCFGCIKLIISKLKEIFKVFHYDDNNNNISLI